MGLTQGDPPELWNLSQPDKVLALHEAFIEAGSDIILTNTFGGTRNRLRLHPGLAERCAEINTKAAHIARQAAANSEREIIVAGSMGPTGDLYEPIGELSIEAASQAYAEQAMALAEGGADVLWIETLSSLEEMSAALQGAASSGLPLVVTASFDSKGRTMMGLTPHAFAEAMQPHSLLAFGANCGAGTPDLAAAVMDMHQAFPKATLVAKSNAGVPEYKDGDFVFSGTIAHMTDYALLMRDMGIRIIGGCCGTSPEHIAAMRQALETVEATRDISLETIRQVLGEPSQIASQKDNRRRRRTSSTVD
jgi:5-methyltetrahydrofolate--homocysteine methyltransferase